MNNPIHAPSLDLSNTTIPSTEPGNKTPTANNCGFVYMGTSPLAQDFLENTCTPQANLLEIGAGFSDVPTLALQKKVHTYTANDLSLDHLKILTQKASLANANINNLYLLPGPAPSALPTLKQSLDAILIDKTLHFLPPQDIESLLNWAHTALKLSGTLYISCAHIHSDFFQALAPQFLRRQHSHDPFPGYFKEFSPHYTQQGLTTPLTLMDSTELTKILHKHHFHPQNTFSMNLPTDNNTWPPASTSTKSGDLIAAIATKKAP